MHPANASLFNHRCRWLESHNLIQFATEESVKVDPEKWGAQFVKRTDLYDMFPPYCCSQWLGGGALLFPTIRRPTATIPLPRRAPHVIPTQLHNCLKTTPCGISHLQTNSFSNWNIHINATGNLPQLWRDRDLCTPLKILFKYNVGIGGKKVFDGKSSTCGT